MLPLTYIFFGFPLLNKGDQNLVEIEVTGVGGQNFTYRYDTIDIKTLLYQVNDTGSCKPLA